MLTRTTLLFEGQPQPGSHGDFLSRRKMDAKQTRGFRKGMAAVRERAVKKFVQRLSIKKTPKTLKPYAPPYKRNSGSLPAGTHFPKSVDFGVAKNNKHAVPMARTLRFMERVTQAAGGQVCPKAKKIGYFRASFPHPKPSKIAFDKIASEFGYDSKEKKDPGDPRPPEGWPDTRRPHEMQINYYKPEPGDTDPKHHVEVPHREIHRAVAHHVDNRTGLFEQRTPLLALSIYQRVA